jgi:hypothetical protein
MDADVDPRERWRLLLQAWSREWLGLERPDGEPWPSEAQAAQWLGADSTDDATLDGLEDRLGVRLPPSYRDFLAVSNGWGSTSPFIDRVFSTPEVGWLRDVDPDFLDLWTDKGTYVIDVSDEDYLIYGDEQECALFRPQLLVGTLLISPPWEGDGVYLLNPCTVTADGEWEAWFFAHWLPGADRYRSFWDLMVEHYKKFRQLELSLED